MGADRCVFAWDRDCASSVGTERTGPERSTDSASQKHLGLCKRSFSIGRARNGNAIRSALYCCATHGPVPIRGCNAMSLLPLYLFVDDERVKWTQFHSCVRHIHPATNTPSIDPSTTKIVSMPAGTTRWHTELLIVWIVRLMPVPYALVREKRTVCMALVVEDIRHVMPSKK
mmetsp:Transcript_5136/g.11550  ORF Transcript_5136/g.11550 Transcript_5136/m.11550 type:complete len:172 (+) Transcript_5136:600-1115(+)